MWEYLAQNMKADVIILVLINLWFCGSGAVTQRGLYRDLFNQNGMDFVTEMSLCKTPVADMWKKMLILATDRGGKSAREIISNLTYL